MEALADERIRISFDLVPGAAAAYLRERSFWISEVENELLLKRIQTLLEEAIRGGETFDEFRKKANAAFDEMKVQRLAPHRLQNVFRTNLFSSHGKAQIEQLQRMTGRFPLWRYSAIIDSATRPERAALNGNIYRVGEGPYPPLRNGEGGGISFNCRCTAQHLHQFQVQQLEVNLLRSGRVLSVSTGKPFTLQQILSDEQSAFEDYRTRVTS